MAGAECVVARRHLPAVRQSGRSRCGRGGSPGGGRGRPGPSRCQDPVALLGHGRGRGHLPGVAGDSGVDGAVLIASDRVAPDRSRSDRGSARNRSNGSRTGSDEIGDHLRGRRPGGSTLDVLVAVAVAVAGRPRSCRAARTGRGWWWSSARGGRPGRCSPGGLARPALRTWTVRMRRLVPGVRDRTLPVASGRSRVRVRGRGRLGCARCGRVCGSGSVRLGVQAGCGSLGQRRASWSMSVSPLARGVVGGEVVGVASDPGSATEHTSAVTYDQGEVLGRALAWRASA